LQCTYSRQTTTLGCPTSESSFLNRVRRIRLKHLSRHVELAQKIQLSQLLIAQAENADASVSIELLIRRILATGATPQEIGKVIAEAG